MRCVSITDHGDVTGVALHASAVSFPAKNEHASADLHLIVKDPAAFSQGTVYDVTIKEAPASAQS